MVRRSVLAGLGALLGIGRSKAEPRGDDQFPPVPVWRPLFDQPLDRIADRLNYYADGKRDFAVFRHGTCAILPEGLADDAARSTALTALSNVFNAHPDMTPTPMDDGNLLLRYHHDVVSIVLSDVARAHWPEIEARHLDGLARAEVLITPLGPNKFDDLGKQALFGRAYMFLDAQAPEIVRIHRHD